jgi:hypothetical protein
VAAQLHQPHVFSSLLLIEPVLFAKGWQSRALMELVVSRTLTRRNAFTDRDAARRYLSRKKALHGRWQVRVFDAFIKHGLTTVSTSSPQYGLTVVDATKKSNNDDDNKHIINDKEAEDNNNHNEMFSTVWHPTILPIPASPPQQPQQLIQQPLQQQSQSQQQPQQQPPQPQQQQLQQQPQQPQPQTMVRLSTPPWVEGGIFATEHKDVWQQLPSITHLRQLTVVACGQTTLLYRDGVQHHTLIRQFTGVADDRKHAIWLPDSRHLVVMEEPSVIAKIILRFVFQSDAVVGSSRRRSVDDDGDGDGDDDNCITSTKKSKL